MTEQNPPTADAQQTDAADLRDAAEMFYHLGYVSTETNPFSSANLVELLENARRVNSERNVTGLLLYREGSSSRYWKAVKQMSKEPSLRSSVIPAIIPCKYCSTVLPTSASFPIGRWGL